MTDGKSSAAHQPPVWKRNEVQSPCIQICVVHPEARICTGCLRSIDEISRWSRMTDAERAAITADLPGRAGQLRKRRGGRAARLERGSGT
ncbi:DUF1289 domain-containing protein [Pelagivirga sediminicola]|uniref:DUF1289 domain-containing protein n=1 Tax=Pelagivirga sediminicola TaxID=2170575 RepID=A0A2T7G973_9RHOB|nr:DUF1289 domain-containing protein [Pelagivirga sediminicola]PVA10972.1 DUF1289 domain-containing protein [Pelagivirga sediminicola]